MSERIAFLGVGRMGSGMVGRLLAAGHAVTVYRPEPGCDRAPRGRRRGAAASAREAVANSVIVMTSLPGPSIVKAAAAEIAGVPGVAVFVDLSTIGPGAAQAVAPLLAPARIAAIDAPVSGGVKGAASGKLDADGFRSRGTR